MIDIDPKVRQYCLNYASAIPKFYDQIQRSTQLKTVRPGMASDEIQGRLLALFSKMLEPELIVEVGTFTAYATAFLAEGLKPDGKLISIEKNRDLKPLIEEHLSLLPIEKEIDVQYGDALSILSNINGPIDIVFIDAGKREYSKYYELVISKVKSGGLIIADNTLWKGKVLESNHDKMTRAIHQFNETISEDKRVEALLLPYRDGLTIMRKN